MDRVLGFDDLWITDSSLHAGDCYVYATLALQSTSTIRVGTAVTNPLTRHPAITANAFRSLSHWLPAGWPAGSASATGRSASSGCRWRSWRPSARRSTSLRSLWSGETVDGEVGPWRFAGAHLLSAVDAPPVLRLGEPASRARADRRGCRRRHPPRRALPGGSRVRPRAPPGGPGKAASGREFEETFFLYGAIDEDESKAAASRPGRSPPGSRRPRPGTPGWPG